MDRRIQHGTVQRLRRHQSRRRHRCICPPLVDGIGNPKRFDPRSSGLENSVEAIFRRISRPRPRRLEASVEAEAARARGRARDHGNAETDTSTGRLRRSALKDRDRGRRLLSSAAMFAMLRKYLRRRKYTAGARLTQFLAPDVRRDVEIVEVSELEEGYVRARIRTWNVLYAVKGMAAVPEFEAPRRVAVSDLWKWTGQPWGGPIPNDDISRASLDD